MASHLPSAWRFDAESAPFVTDGATIRVVALRAGEAARLEGAREQVDALCRELFKRSILPVASAERVVADAFDESAGAMEATQPARTVLAYYDAEPDAPRDRVVAFTQVAFDGERVMISPIAVASALSEQKQQQLLRAAVLATEELAMAIAHEAMDEQPGQPLVIWRDQVGAPDFLRTLLSSDGYSTKLTERLEMTAWLQQLGSADAPIGETEVDGVDIRPLDLANDDVAAVWGVLKEAFSPNPPSFEAWKRHYAQQPRFAPELSFVAWFNKAPIAVSCVERIVEGQGGGDEEVTKVFSTHHVLVKRGASSESFSVALEFADDYEERKQEIHAAAKVGYVCGVATLPAFRGKRLAQTLLRHNFREAARAGLDSVYLGTDRYNPPAVRAYELVGMVETKAVSPGDAVAKIVRATPRVWTAERQGE